MVLTVLTAAPLSGRKGVLEPRKNIEGVRGTTNLQYRGLLSNTNCRQPRAAASQAGIDGLERGCWRTWDTINTKLRSSDK
jgi:hypothetical protein